MCHKKSKLSKKRRIMKKKTIGDARLEKNEVEKLYRYLYSIGFEVLTYNPYHDLVSNLLVLNNPTGEIVVFFDCDYRTYAIAETSCDKFMYEVIDENEPCLSFSEDMTTPDVIEVLRKKTRRRIENGDSLNLFYDGTDYDYAEELEAKLENLSDYEMRLFRMYDFVLAFDKEFTRQQDELLLSE